MLTLFWSFINFVGIFLLVFSCLYIIRQLFFLIRDVFLTPVPKPNSYTERQVLMVGIALTYIITFIII